MNNFLNATRKILTLATSIFPHFFAKFTKEEFDVFSETLSDSLELGVDWLWPARRDDAELGLAQNFNTIEWMILARVRAEEKENVERILKLVKESAIIGGGAVITAIPFLAKGVPDGR